MLFFTPHSVTIVGAGWRDHTVARIGERPWKAGYALVSAIGLVLIIWGYGVARQEPVLLYLPPDWLRYVTILLMLFVFPLLFAAYLPPGRIKTITRHPILAAVKTWAFAHLLVNGALPSALNDVIAVVAGLALYATFVLWLHRWFIGVPVMG